MDAFRENQTLRDTLRHTVETGIESRTGNRTVVTEVFDKPLLEIESSVEISWHL